MNEQTPCKHASIASCPFPSNEYCSYGKCPGMGDNVLINFVVNSGNPSTRVKTPDIMCENHDQVWNAIAMHQVGTIVSVTSPTNEDVSIFAPFNEPIEKGVTIDAAILNWLSHYTWEQENGEYDFTMPRFRTCPLTSIELEMVDQAINGEVVINHAVGGTVNNMDSSNETE